MLCWVRVVVLRMRLIRRYQCELCPRSLSWPWVTEYESHSQWHRNRGESPAPLKDLPQADVDEDSSYYICTPWTVRSVLHRAELSKTAEELTDEYERTGDDCVLVQLLGVVSEEPPARDLVNRDIAAMLDAPKVEVDRRQGFSLKTPKRWRFALGVAVALTAVLAGIASMVCSIVVPVISVSGTWGPISFIGGFVVIVGGCFWGWDAERKYG